MERERSYQPRDYPEDQQAMALSSEAPPKVGLLLFFEQHCSSKFEFA